MHLYVHIPFCHHICPYCAFYKHKPGNLANEAFVAAILAEAQTHRELSGRELRTIYFGGGTPSLLSGKLLTQLCNGIRDQFDLSSLQEWTIEANPATFDQRKAATMRQLGINRVSLGVQSFQSDTLKTLGRDHSPQSAIEAFQSLRSAGIRNISIDLMFSIPGQDSASWQSDLETAVALEPDHFSAYNLTYEEDTEFLTRHEQGELDASEDRDANLFYQAIDFLEEHGFRHYEISNYARSGFESVHNQAYWKGADYLGLGPGAVSTIGSRRWKTLPDTAAYIDRIQKGEDAATERETLTDEDRRLEAIGLQLRTAKGVPTALIQSPDPVESLNQQGYIVEHEGHYVLTREGKALADPIAGMLV